MAKKRGEKNKRETRSIVVGHLEKISARVFDDYSGVITGMIKGHQGIYALYKNDRLYYVGLATNLRNRIRHHLKDRHRNKWTHFSLYIIRKSDHVKETESLVLRISDPAGNFQKGKLTGSLDLRPELKRLLTKDIKNILDELLGKRSKTTPKKKKKAKKTGESRPLKGKFPTGKMIYANYKGENYKAWVNSIGRIRYAETRYDTPTAAAKAIVSHGSVNGWIFWEYKDKSGNLKKLKELRK